MPATFVDTPNVISKRTVIKNTEPFVHQNSDGLKKFAFTVFSS